MSYNKKQTGEKQTNCFKTAINFIILQHCRVTIWQTSLLVSQILWYQFYFGNYVEQEITYIRTFQCCWLLLLQNNGHVQAGDYALNF